MTARRNVVYDLFMKYLVAGVLCLAACTRANPERTIPGRLPGETCSTPQSCGAGSYMFCFLGNDCRYLTNDGESFKCASCDACNSAQIEIASWCATPATNGGTTAGGTTAGGTTVGGTTTGGTTAGGTTAGGTTTGGTTVGGTTAGGTTTGGTTGTSTCAQCSNDAGAGTCSSQVNTCNSDNACATLAGCLQGCSDSTCEQNCWSSASPQAQQEALAAFQCICDQCSQSCAAECSSLPGSTSGGTNGGNGSTTGGNGSTTGGNGGTTGGTTCDSCVQSAESSTCSSQTSTCNGDPNCANLFKCLDGCMPNDSTCQNNCYNSAGMTAQSQYDAWATCVCMQCSVCGC